MAAIIAGEAAVRIVPTLKNFHGEVRRRLKDEPHKLIVQVEANTKAASAELDAWRDRQQLNPVRVPVRADFQSFQRDLSQVEHIFERSSLSKAIRINLVVLGLDALPALAYAAGSAASGLDALAKSSLALPGILGGALSAAGALAVGLHGVKDAFQAYNQDSDKATDNARKQQDADRDLTSAKRSLQDAIRDQKREMEDLNAEMRRGSLNEADVLLSIQEDLDRLKQGGFKSVTEFQRAQLGLLQDTDRLNEVRTKNNRTIEDGNKANAEGVQGSDRVANALDRVAKAQEALDESKVTQVSKALEKLAPNASAAVQAVHSLGDEWKNLVANPVGNALFADVDKQVVQLGQHLPVLGTGLSNVASGLNVDLKAILSSLGTDKNTSLLSRIFGDTEGGLQNAAKGIDPLIHGILQLTSQSATFLPRLGDAADKVFGKFDAWVGKISSNGQLDKWIDQGLKAVDELGRSIGHIVSIVDSVSNAFDKASGHTGGFVQNLDNATGKLADFLSSDKGQEKLTGYFKDAGSFVKDLGHDLEEAKPLFKDIASAAHDWGQILFTIIGYLGKLADAVQRNTGLMEPLIVGYLGFRTVRPIIEGVGGAMHAYEDVSGAVARQGGVGGILSTALENTKTKITGVGNEAGATSNKIKAAAAEEVIAEDAVADAADDAAISVAGGGVGKDGKKNPKAPKASRSSKFLTGLKGIGSALPIIGSAFAIDDAETDSGISRNIGDDAKNKDWGHLLFGSAWDLIPGHATGGLVKGVGGPTDDSNLVRMSAGEHVTKAAAVNYYGADLFNSLNNMQIPRHNGGSPDLPTPPAIPGAAAPTRSFIGPPLPPARPWGGANIGPPVTDLGGIAPADAPDFANRATTPGATLGGQTTVPTPVRKGPQGFNFGGAGTGGDPPPILPLTTPGLAPGDAPYAGAKSYNPNDQLGRLSGFGTDFLKGGAPTLPWWTPGSSLPAAAGEIPTGRGNTVGSVGAATHNFPGSLPPGITQEQWNNINNRVRAEGAGPHSPGALGSSLPTTQTSVTPHAGNGSAPGPVAIPNSPYAVAPGAAGPVIAPSGPVMGTMRGLIDSMVGTPYIPGGNSLAGTDCSGLAAFIANIASGRPALSGRFDTHNELQELTARGFLAGAGTPGQLTIGWNDEHTAITLPDGTSVSSGENGGVKYGGGGANQNQFTNWMHLPVNSNALANLPGLAGLPGVGSVPGLNGQLPGGGALPKFLQPQSIIQFLGSQAQSVGSGFSKIGLGLLQGFTGLNFGPLVQDADQIANGAISGFSGDGSGGAGTALNADAADDMQRYLNGQLPLGSSGAGTGGSGSSYTPGGGAEQWRPLVRQVLTQIGPKYGINTTNEKAWEDALVKQIGTESGGNPNSGNLHDSDGHGGTQSVAGILNFLPSTFNANNITGGSFMDPTSQIAAAIPYVVNKYGINPDGSPKGIGLGHGFAGGGTPGDGVAAVSSGEFITNNKATSYYGAGLYNALNSMSIPKKAIGGFASGGFFGGIPRFEDGMDDGTFKPPPPVAPPGAPGSAAGPLPIDAPAPPPQAPPPDPNQAPGAPLGQAPFVAPPSAGGAPGPGATAPDPSPGALPQVAQTLAGMFGGGTGGGASGGLSQPGSTDPNSDDDRAALGTAPTSYQHNNPAVQQGIQGIASTIGSAASMAASLAVDAGSGGIGALGGGSAVGAGIQAGAQMAGQVATGVTNILSSFLVGTATPGSTSQATGVPLLPQRQPTQSGVPQIVQQRIHQGDINLTNLDEFQRQQQMMDAQNAMPFIGNLS